MEVHVVGSSSYTQLNLHCLFGFLGFYYHMQQIYSIFSRKSINCVQVNAKWEIIFAMKVAEAGTETCPDEILWCKSTRTSIQKKNVLMSESESAPLDIPLTSSLLE